MGTIVNTMIQGLTEQMVQARLNSADASGFLFGKHFPVKKVNGFNWKTLTNQLERRMSPPTCILTTELSCVNAARYSSARGDIPFISISRELSRSEIKDYQTALAFAQDEDATKLVEYWEMMLTSVSTAFSLRKNTLHGNSLQTLVCLNSQPPRTQPMPMNLTLTMTWMMR